VPIHILFHERHYHSAFLKNEAAKYC